MDITRVANFPEEDGLEVEVETDKNTTVRVSKQLHTCQDGTARLPKFWDFDEPDCKAFLTTEDVGLVDPEEKDCQRILGTKDGEGLATFQRILEDAVAMVGKDGYIPNQEGILYEEPQKQYVTVWLDEEDTPDHKGHWLNFTEEAFDQLNKEKAFPNGYTDYYIRVNNEGIIREDTLHPEAKGKIFSEEYPNFNSKKHSYEAYKKLKAPREVAGPVRSRSC